MKSKKIAALLLAGSMIMSLAACNNSGKKTREDDETTTTTTEETTTEATTEATTTEATTEETTEAGIPDVSDTEATSETAESSESKAGGVTAFSGKFDFDDMHFYVNGKKYTLGKTTLQEMIDDGVPFKASDIKNASVEMKKNSQSLNGIGIECDKFWAPMVYVMNDSTEAKPMSECIIFKVYMHSIEKNYKNGANISFDFPYQMTMDELIAIAGEPKDANGKTHDEGTNGNYTDTLRYKQKAKKYIGSREYQFVFAKGQMSRIIMTYIP